MTIIDIIGLFPDSQKMQVYDFDSDKVVFDGMSDDLPEKYENVEISSIDNIGKYGANELIVNVSLED